MSMNIFLNKFFSLITAIAIISSISGCSNEKPFTGKVIDSETGQPVEGVVALVTWSTSRPTPAGSVSDYHDIYETVTNSAGEFTVPGKGLYLGFKRSRWVTFFKAGFRPRTGQKKDYKDSTKEKQKIVQLKRLTIEQRKAYGPPPSPPLEAPSHKIKHFLNELEKDRAERGRKSSRSFNGTRYE